MALPGFVLIDRSAAVGLREYSNALPGSRWASRAMHLPIFVVIRIFGSEGDGILRNKKPPLRG
jgi:hypothetical protein